jgi:two-component system OmpR family sensor kinase
VRHRRPPPPAWRLVRGVHRRLVLYLLTAALLGGLAGAALSGGLGAGGASPWVGLLPLVLIWPLAWRATFRIARPLRELARVAHALRQGQLQRRAALPGDDGEVGEVSEALSGMAERLERQLHDQRALLGAVSHELRSPLGRLRLLAELSREGRGGPDLADRLDREVDGMEALVAELLAAARVDLGAADPRPLDAAAELRGALAAAGLPADLLEPPAPDLPPVRADPSLLRHALLILLDNAARHGGGARAARLLRAEGGLRVEVDDAGPGFPAGGAEAAFAGRGRRGAGGGVGLGLGLVRRIAELAGGAAGGGDRPGGGARVWLELPAV